MYMLARILNMGTTAKRNKHFVLDADKIKRAQRVLGTKTETETIEQALDQVISEDERNRRAWSATERFLRSGAAIEDVFGSLARK
jgi:hypothetical protein